MNEELNNQVLKLLEENESLIESKTVTHDYESLKQYIMQLELKQEINALKEMLNLDNFEEQFKKRCAQRENSESDEISENSESGKVLAIPFSKMPESITNKLYWDIVQLIFKPKKQYEVLDIIAPSITTRLKISSPDYNSVPDGLDTKEKQEYIKQAKPKIDECSICNGLTQFPDFEALSYYVMKDKELIDLRDIKDFHLPLHASLLKELDQSWHQQLYSHNSRLKNLSLDIDILNKNGTNPKVMITNLISRCLSGGSRMTGSDHASKDAEIAELEFLAYLNSLPEDTQNLLKALKYNGTHTLQDIIEKEIKINDCVETTASHLKNLLQNNKKEKSLDTLVKMTTSDLKALMSKYLKGLNVRKDPFIDLINCPKGLIKEAIKNISIKDGDDLIGLFFVFPPQLYSILLECVNVIYDDENEVECIMTDLVEDNRLSRLFNFEQKMAITKAVENNYDSFQPDGSIIFWALNSEDPEILEEVLKNASLSVIKQDLLEDAFGGLTLLHREEITLQTLKLLLEKLTTDEEKYAAINKSPRHGGTALNYAVKNPQVLKEMFSYYTKKQKVKALKVINHEGKTLLHLAARHPVSLKIIFSSLSKEECFDALKPICTKIGTTVVHDAAINSPESLKVIMSFLSEKQQLDLLKIVDKQNSMVLFSTLGNVNSLQILFELLPKKYLFEILKTEGILLNFDAIKCSQSLKLIFKSTTKEQRLELLNCVDKNGTTMFSYALSNPESISAIFYLLTEAQRLSLLESASKDDGLQLAPAFHNPRSLKIMFDFFSQEQRISLFKKETIKILCKNSTKSVSLTTFLEPFSVYQRLELLKFDDMAMLRIAIEYPESLKVLFDLVPEEEMFKTLKTPLKTPFQAETLLSLVAQKYPKSLEVILKSISDETERLDVLQLSTRKNVPILYYVLSNPELRRVIIELLSAELLCSLDSMAPLLSGLAQYKPEIFKDILEPLFKKNKSFKGTATVLVGAVHQVESLRVFVKYFPKDTLFEVFKRTNKDGISLLQCLAGKPESLKIILTLLQEKQWLEEFRRVNKNGDTAIDFSPPQSLKIMLEVLPEEHRLILLKMVMNRSQITVLEQLIENKIEFISENDAFKDSFVPHYIRIMTILLQMQEKDNNLGFFSSNLKTEAMQLKESLDSKSSFTEIKEELMDYAKKNEDTSLSKEILICLNSSGYGGVNKRVREDNHEDDNSDGRDLKKVKFL